MAMKSENPLSKTVELDYSDDVHGGRQEISRILEKAKTDLTPKNYDAVLKYFAGNKTKAILSQRRSLYDAYTLLKQLGKDFDQVTEEDIRKWWQALVDRYAAETLSGESVRKCFWQCKKFFRMAYGLKKHRFPPCVDWMEWDSAIKSDPTVDPKFLPSQDDIFHLIRTVGGENGIRKH